MQQVLALSFYYYFPPSHVKLVCMCRQRLKKKGGGAYGADQTEKVGAFRGERTV